MVAQGYRELGAIALFEHSRAWAPDAGATARLQHQADEERGHLSAVTGVWTELTGAAHPGVFLARVTERLAQNPLPEPACWYEVAVAQFLYDRAGYHQLQEYAECSYPPYQAIVRPILAEESQHQDAGASDLLESLSPGPDAQDTFDRWLAVALKSFGRSGSTGSARAIALRLKRRDPAWVAQDFLHAIRPIAHTLGFRRTPLAQLGIELPSSVRW